MSVTAATATKTDDTDIHLNSQPASAIRIHTMEIIQNEKAMDLLREVGSDQVIIPYIFNFKDKLLSTNPPNYTWQFADKDVPMQSQALSEIAY